ncbi:MAG: VCBS repeat-containing protein [Pseudomonadales bacterium]|jgi:hypothetical protein|nr:VCBS repeat-containing protein [Pseudomonadales bacterium]MDP7360949.1 VCBS repeat-containing protein [Pseudomonadales bacterium]MDP7595275.1 VCBS repeat-containing protein [Pseudomonadales bacterium]HJN49537.1 VCBS repeat-containing protein [Pseudomonadales bacterium]|tara:strand:- start:659 stop:2158 length:1500 start_codon:yes stop_codon:yes gene_type:complete
MKSTRILLAAGLMLVAMVIEGSPLFELSQLRADGEIKHGLTAAFLTDPDHANILARIIADDKRRYVSVYAMTDDHHYLSEPVSALEIDDEVIFLGTGKVLSGETESLLLFKRDQALIVNLRTGEQSELIRFKSLYMHPVPDQLPSFNWVRDINGDELADVMVPDFDGYWLYLQIEAGVFDQGRLIKMPAIMEVSYRNFPWYRPANPYFADINLDKLQDIVFWDRDELKVFFQDSRFTYRTTVASYQPAIELQDEGLTGLSLRLGGADDQSNVEAKSLYNFTDLNGDGFVDIVTLSVRSSSVLNKTSRYEIYMGYELDGKVSHPSLPESVIESNGIQFEMDEQDFNNDGAVDFVISSVEIGLGKILAALITGSISTDLRFYRMQGDRYPAKPNVTREVTADFSLSSGEVFYPTVMIADINGDRIMDLVVQDGNEGLKVFAGELNDDLFARRPTEFAVEMPNNPDLISATDLNRDGKTDIMIRYEERDTELHRSINVLMAR